jgi:hypothetical protein
MMLKTYFGVGRFSQYVTSLSIFSTVSLPHSNEVYIKLKSITYDVKYLSLSFFLLVSYQSAAHSIMSCLTQYAVSH